MSTPEDYRPRLSVELTREQKEKLDRYLGPIHGAQKAVFSIIVDDLIAMLEKPNGPKYLSGLLQRYINLNDFSGPDKRTE